MNSIKFKEIILTKKTYSAEDVIEIIKIVDESVRNNFYINPIIKIKDVQQTIKFKVRR